MKQFVSWRHSLALVIRAVRSNKFFWLLLGIFLFEAVWVALSGAYSMAFDEYFHLGKIQLYAQQWSPFFSGTPDGSTQFGAVARDPSYLYHYLFSFPYRVFAYFFESVTAQVIFLRLLGVGLFAGGLLAFRSAFRRAGISLFLGNVSLFFFVVLPVVPFLAGQINYDNLLFLVAGVSILLAVSLANQVRATGVMPVRLCLGLGALLLLGSLVKYAFLPFMLGVAVYVLAMVWRTAKQRGYPVWRVMSGDRINLKRISTVLLCLVFVVSCGLFAERYIGNTISYHTPTPDCDTVIGLDACRDYDPFARNQHYKELGMKNTVSVDDKWLYPFSWLGGMMRSLFFAVGPRQLHYPAGEPLPLAYAAGWVVAVGGLALLLVRARWLLRNNPAFPLFLAVIGLYGLVLFLQNLSDFLQLGVAVAVQGRYALLILPLLFVLVATAARDVVRRFTYGRRIGATVVVILCLLMAQGGGLLPFVIRSADAWMWPNSFMERANHTVRNVLWHTTIR